jgi:hypothetical protein
MTGPYDDLLLCGYCVVSYTAFLELGVTNGGEIKNVNYVAVTLVGDKSRI